MNKHVKLTNKKWITSHATTENVRKENFNELTRFASKFSKWIKIFPKYRFFQTTISFFCLLLVKLFITDIVLAKLQTSEPAVAYNILGESCYINKEYELIWIGKPSPLS